MIVVKFTPMARERISYFPGKNLLRSSCTIGKSAFEKETHPMDISRWLDCFKGKTFDQAKK